jgi:hypothetical protein
VFTETEETNDEHGEEISSENSGAEPDEAS